jgi:ribosome-associated protein
MSSRSAIPPRAGAWWAPPLVSGYNPTIMTTPRTDHANTPDRARQLALAAARVADETRGTDIRILDLRGITPVFDYFVIATGSSRRQMHAMADEIEATLKTECRDRKRGGEGYEEGRWIVLDYGDVMVHLFDAEARSYWDIEHLWSDAVPVPVPAAGAATR